MSNNTWFARILRFVGIVLMGLTAAFTILGGIGTFCAALFPTRYESMSGLIPYQGLYIFFMISGILIGIWGIVATVLLVRGARSAYLNSLVALGAGVVIGGFHIYMSRMLRGKSMPVDAVVYASVLTLIVFLLFRLPGIWQGVDFSKGNSKSNRPAGGAAAILAGIMTLSIQYMMAATHTWDGINYADAFNTTLTMLGGMLVLGGIGLLAASAKIDLKAAESEGRPVRA